MDFKKEYEKLIKVLKDVPFGPSSKDVKARLISHETLFNQYISAKSDTKTYEARIQDIYSEHQVGIFEKNDNWLIKGNVVIRLITKSGKEQTKYNIDLSHIYTLACADKRRIESDPTAISSDLAFIRDSIIMLHIYRLIKIVTADPRADEFISLFSGRCGLKEDRPRMIEAPGQAGEGVMGTLANLAQTFIGNNPALGEMLGGKSIQELMGSFNLNGLVDNIKTISESGVIGEVLDKAKNNFNIDPSKGVMDNINSVIQNSDKISETVNDLLTNDKVKEFTTELTKAGAPILNNITRNMPTSETTTTTTETSANEATEEVVYDD